MNVVVKFHGSAAPSIVAWQRRLLARPPHDPNVFAVMRDTMVQEFQRTHGLPPGCVHIDDPIQPYYSWRFAGDIRVHFVRKPARIGRAVTVVVIGLTDQPPPLKRDSTSSSDKTLSRSRSMKPFIKAVRWASSSSKKI